MNISVLPVINKKQLRAFIDFPHELYKNDAKYVPELFIAQRDLLTKGKYPFHEHSDVQLFLAYEGVKLCGRIAAIYNRNHNTFNKVNDGFFGFFECTNNLAAASALITAAIAWLKNKTAASIIGPVNFSTNETCGLLINGFDSPPCVMMPYNPPYYADLLKQLGFHKKTDLLAYRFETHTHNKARLDRMSERLKERLVKRNITFRTIDLKDFKKEATRIREVYNAAWDRNMGFVPLTEEEFYYQAKDLKLILDKDFCCIAEHEGKIVGFSLAIPDINTVLIRIKKGRLFPSGLFKLLLLKNKIKGIRIIALGVIEGYRKLGIEQCFYASIVQNARKKNIEYAEASWLLEDNLLINKAMQEMNGSPYKRYRILEKAI